VSATTADVVVVGGGVNGASIAHALAARGVRVALVEQSAMASGASGRSSALVRMHYTNEWDARLAWASYPVFAQWPEVMGGPPVFTRTGFLNLVGPEDAEALRQNVAMLRGIGVETTALGPAEVAALQPFMQLDDVGAAAYEPASGYASPADVVEGFRRRARERGARVLDWTAVTAPDRSRPRSWSWPLAPGRSGSAAGSASRCPRAPRRSTRCW
jgi:sarcosine oxidase subunit beta